MTWPNIGPGRQTLSLALNTCSPEERIGARVIPTQLPVLPSRSPLIG
jgi:hypothetical protein